MVALARVCFRLVYWLVKVVSIIGYNYSNGLVKEVSAIPSCKCIEERVMNKIRLSGWDRMIVKRETESENVFLTLVSLWE